MDTLESRHRHLCAALAASPGTRLLAVSKGQPVASMRRLAGLGQRAFGENYVQEARSKQRELADLELEWHLIGPLQSNKCREAAQLFDWVQTVDRAKLLPLLDRERPAGRAPLNLLLQVNIDDEPGKSGCAPEQLQALADQASTLPRLALRGLMAIPMPRPDPQACRPSFDRMRRCFDALRRHHPGCDTLSLGMSADWPVAIEAGATLVRIGSALFGPRPTKGIHE